MKRLLLLIVVITITGCTRVGDHPLSSKCEWSEQDNHSLDLTKFSERRHLRFDALTAEDMAIRWADQNYGHQPQYGPRRDECMATLFAGVARMHGVDVGVVRDYTQDRDVIVDAAVILSFGILFAVAAYIFAGRVAQRFPPGEPGFWVMSVTMAIGVSLVGAMVGNLWSIVFESLRLNSGHLSYRMDRIPWRQHWIATLGFCLVIFTLTTLIRARPRFTRSAVKTS